MQRNDVFIPSCSKKYMNGLSVEPKTSSAADSTLRGSTRLTGKRFGLRHQSQNMKDTHNNTHTLQLFLRALRRVVVDFATTSDRATPHLRGVDEKPWVGGNVFNERRVCGCKHGERIFRRRLVHLLVAARVRPSSG